MAVNRTPRLMNTTIHYGGKDDGMELEARR
jgi:hypothetical protein